ncbi:MAG TPA: LytR C-terminal domain-containing protein [Solirubrobacterales bacterium]|nr:LytR C-terminal domain-containing protein [Solirubrobacterales bacterium]
MGLSDLVDAVAPFAAIPSAIAFLLLLPLYLSQRRDIIRMRTWIEREPYHPASDLRASEAQLDRAESELERLLGTGGDAVADTVVQSPAAARVAATTAAARVTSERPALARITIERAALEPHPRWRRFARRATQPRVLAAIAILAVIGGAVAIVGSERLLSGDTEREAPVDSFDPSAVSVTVMNGTELKGLGSRVESDVSANEYEVIAVTSAPIPAAWTEVMFVRGQREEALRVAQDLGVRESRVGPMDPDIRQLSGGADVVVIAGEDRG